MKVVKHNSYYHLGHSFRHEGRVIYKEKYLGKELPKNLEEIKEIFLRECMQEGIFKKLRLIQKNFSKEWKKYPESIKKEILIDLSISFTYNTNAIEGSTLTLEETRGVAPPSIMFATRGALIDLPIFFISSIDFGASMKIASAPIFLY